MQDQTLKRIIFSLSTVILEGSQKDLKPEFINQAKEELQQLLNKLPERCVRTYISYPYSYALKSTYYKNFAAYVPAKITNDITYYETGVVVLHGVGKFIMEPWKATNKRVLSRIKDFNDTQSANDNIQILNRDILDESVEYTVDKKIEGFMQRLKPLHLSYVRYQIAQFLGIKYVPPKIPKGIGQALKTCYHIIHANLSEEAYEHIFKYYTNSLRPMYWKVVEIFGLHHTYDNGIRICMRRFGSEDDLRYACVNLTLTILDTKGLGMAITVTEPAVGTSGKPTDVNYNTNITNVIQDLGLLYAWMIAGDDEYQKFAREIIGGVNYEIDQTHDSVPELC